MKKLTENKIFFVTTLIGIIFLYFPIMIMIAYSFNASKLMTSWSGFSIKWYQELLHDKEIIHALLTSLKISIFAATVSSILGLIIALFLSSNKNSNWKKRIVEGVINIQFTVPEVIIGLSLLLLFVSLERTTGLFGGRNWFTVVIAHTTLAISYVTILIKAKIDNLNTSVFEAASDLGAKPFCVFRKITLPLIRPALINGWLLAFILSMDDLVIASFTSGPGSTTLPMLIHSRIRLGLSPEINALASVLIIIIMFIGIFSNFITIKNKNNNRK
ncbi:MAG: ABC transporter permease [Sphingobacteriia bacterium]|nr:ABC transporter permease [Sphingobacteriia bacterium]